MRRSVLFCAIKKDPSEALCVYCISLSLLSLLSLYFFNPQEGLGPQRESAVQKAKSEKKRRLRRKYTNKQINAQYMYMRL